MENNSIDKNTIQQLKDKISTLTKRVAMLQRSEKLLANAIYDAPIGMITLTVDGKFKTANMAFCKITGYTDKELLSMNISQITYPGDRHIGDKIIKDLTSGKAKKAKFQKRYIHKNGNTICAQVSTVILKDEVGTPQIFFTQVIDITERRQAEQKLSQSEENYRGLFNNSTDAIYIQDKEGRFLDVNEEVSKMYGYPREYFIGKTPEPLSAPGKNDLDKIAEHIKLAFKGEPQQFEFWGLRSNGEVFPKIVRLKKGKYFKQDVLIAFATDITKHKWYEKSLQESEEKLASTVEGAGLGLWDQDFSSGIVKRNRRWAQMLGYELDEIEQSRSAWRKLIHPDDLVSIEKSIIEHEQGITPIFSVEHRMRTKTGEWKWIHNWGRVVERDKDGKPLRALGVHLDIDDRKQVEEMLKESEERFRIIFDNEPECVKVLNPDLTIVNMNPAGLAMIEAKSLDEVKGQSVLNIINKEYRADFKKLNDNICKKGVSGTLGYWITGFNGTQRYLETHAVPLRNPKGEVTSSLSVTVDITKRKRVEKEIEQQSIELEKQFKSSEKQRIATLSTLSDLNETTKKLQSEIIERKRNEEKLTTANKELELMGKTINSMKECVSITDAAHKYIFANKAWEETYGYKKEEIIGKTSKIIQIEEQTELRRAIRQKTKLGGWKGELTNRKKDGTIFPTELSITPLRNKQGKIIAHIGISTDITERKKTEEALKITQTSVDKLPDAVYWMNQDAKFVYVNNAAVKALGYTREKLLTMTVHDIGPEFPKEVWSAHWTELKKKGSFVIRTIHKRKDKSTFPVEITLNFIKFGDREINCAIAKDITERKIAENEIKDREEKIKQAQRIAKLGHYSLNIKTGLWTTSDELNEIFGIDKKFKKDTTGWMQIIHPDFQEIMSNYLQDNIIKQYQNFDREYKIISIKTQQEKWVHGLGTLKFDRNNKPIELFGTIQDITDRKTTEEALLDSEIKYRQFFMDDLTGDYLSTREGKIIDCNPQFLKIFGFKSLNQAQKYDATKLYKSKAERNVFIKKLEKNKVLVDEQSEQNKVNGEKIIVRENVSGEFDNDGNLINIRGYIYDITDSIKAEQEIAKLSSAVEQSPVSIVITNTEGVIEYVNPTFEKLTGYSTEEAIGAKPSILKSGVTPDSEYSKLWKRITAGKVWIGEFLNKKKNGELYWESATVSPIFDNKNNITHFLAVKEDVTKKKEIVSELMEREEKYRTLTQNLNVGVYRSTPGKDGMFVEANPAFLKIFGFRSKNELERYKTVDFYADPIERNRIEEKLTSKGFLINEEVKLKKKDGSIFFASISSTSATDELGKVTHHDGIVEDITERKEMMERVIQERDRSQLYLDIAGVMFLALDRNGNIILANQKTCEIVGTKEKDLIGKNWIKNHIPEDIRLNVKDVFSTHLNGNAEIDEFHENEILTMSGERRLIAWHNSLLKDESGKIFGVISSGLDITESKEDEELRNQLYETSRSLAESLDIDVVLNRMSKQARALLKCNGVTIYMCEDDKKTLKPVVAYDPPYTKQVLATKIGINNSLTGQAIKAKKGKIFNYNDNQKGAFHIKGTPENDTDNIIVSPLQIDGKIIGALTLVRSEVPFTDKDLNIVNTFAVYGSTAIKNANSHKQILREIEERKHAQKLLKESHDRYESIFNGATDGIIYTNLDGNIISANLSIEKLFSIKRKDLIGKNAIELAKSETSGKTLKRFLGFINRILKGEEIRDYLIKTNSLELEFNSKKGKGKSDITVMVRDVTERNKARKNVELHQNNLATLSNELTMAEEKAKRHLAITLHDKLGQSLVLANFRSNELNKIVEKPEHKKIINEISGFLTDAINESRSITYELSPPVLYEMGLVPAINWKLDEIEKNNSIKTSLIDRSKSHKIEKREQIILYRSINELLQNVLKHSKAESVNVSFRLLTNDYRIIVRDNGVGFNLNVMKEKALSQKKFGLFSIIERIKYIGGSVEIDTKPKKGTKIIINMPIKNK